MSAQSKPSRQFKTKIFSLFSLIASRKFASLTLLFWCSYFAIYWVRSYLLIDGSIYSQSLATWADGAVHLTYISAMAYRPTFPNSLPVYLGEPFFYPFVADYLSAILVKLGINLFTAYATIGLILSLILVLLLYRFYHLITKNHQVAGLSLILTFASGGLGFYYYFLDKLKDGFDFTAPIVKEYTLLDDQGIYWINIITGELLPQRPFLLGMIFGLFTLIVLIKLVFFRQPARWQLILAGLLFGLLPITHPHTLLTLSVVIGWLFLYSNYPKPKFKTWLFFIIPTLILGLPLVATQILPRSGDFITWYPGWLAKTKDINFIWFWFINWGFLPLAIILGYRFSTRIQKVLLIPTIAIFILANLFLFQPYDWDNAKILTWSYLLLAPFAAQYLHHLFKQKVAHQLTALILLFLLTAAGTIDLIRQFTPYTTIQMFPKSDLAIAQTVKSQLPADAVFLTSDHHLHPIPTLTGRQIVMGYPGWLWSYGINYGQRERDIMAIYTAKPEAQDLINQYQIDYIVIGPHEFGRYNPNTEFFEQHYTPVIRQDSYTIYQVD